ncbi:hypothetical protein GGR44_000012 [Sphingobium fontiphilum]|uniref:Acyltransferase 3 domain-containing protein n=1 Tax=Sphingobium fontiphilum TaxID=944425 RepID=A0A7W6DFM1_9SPHN|nr:hypothetical protein [Sphingobium fontiphilum]
MPLILPIDASRRSAAIAIARSLCILGVVYVHAWTGIGSAELAALRGTGQDALRWTLMEALGRSAVPLLGLISGWLVASSARSRDWGPFVRRKARSILLPMILWNALAISLVSGAAWLWTLPAPVPTSWEWVAQELFILTRNPDINVQMPFLRDLFLCMVVAPLLVRLPAVALLALAGLAGVAHVAGLGPPVLMRAAILCFFLLGMVAWRWGWADRTVAWPFWMSAMPFAVAMPVRLALALQWGAPQDNMVMAAIDLVSRVAAALFFWRLAWALVPTRAGAILRRIEPFAFFLFCAHLILIWLGGPLIGRIVGRMGSPLYPLFLLLQPALILMAAAPMASALNRLSPVAAALLSGGRLGRR